MKRVTLDLTNIQTPRDMHAYIAYVMDSPAYYGRNLDALYDMLTEISEPTLLCIRRPAALAPELQAYFPKMARMLHDAQEENGNLQVVVDIA